MYVFNVYVWGPHGGWAMLSGLVHTCMYVFNFYWFCTFLYIPVPSLNKDIIIIIIIITHVNAYPAQLINLFLLIWSCVSLPRPTTSSV